MLFFEKEGEERSWMSPNPTEGAGQKHDLPTKVDWRKLGGWFWTEPCIAVHVATQRASTGIAARCILWGKKQPALSKAGGRAWIRLRAGEGAYL